MDEKTCVMPQELPAENDQDVGFFEVVVLRCECCGGSGWEDKEAGEECSCCGGSGDYSLKVPISWDTTKNIYRALVEWYSSK